jgi:hypothetical protein
MLTILDTIYDIPGTLKAQRDLDPHQSKSVPIIFGSVTDWNL